MNLLATQKGNKSHPARDRPPCGAWLWLRRGSRISDVECEGHGGSPFLPNCLMGFGLSQVHSSPAKNLRSENYGATELLPPPATRSTEPERPGCPCRWARTRTYRYMMTCLRAMARATCGLTIVKDARWPTSPVHNGAGASAIAWVENSTAMWANCGARHEASIVGVCSRADDGAGLMTICRLPGARPVVGLVWSLQNRTQIQTSSN